MRNVKTKGVLGSLLCLCMMLVLVPSSWSQGDAEKNYKAKCALCHAPDGSGATTPGKAMGVPDFRSPDVQKESDEALTEAISKGKNKMPKYADKLKDSEIKDLIAYMRELGKKK